MLKPSGFLVDPSRVQICVWASFTVGYHPRLPKGAPLRGTGSCATSPDSDMFRRGSEPQEVFQSVSPRAASCSFPRRGNPLGSHGCKPMVERDPSIGATLEGSPIHEPPCILPLSSGSTLISATYWSTPPEVDPKVGGHRLPVGCHPRLPIGFPLRGIRPSVAARISLALQHIRDCFNRLLVDPSRVDPKVGAYRLPVGCHPRLVRLRAYLIREVKVLSRSMLQPVTECNCTRREAGWRATGGERPVRRITNPFRPGTPASLLASGEAWSCLGRPETR